MFAPCGAYNVRTGIRNPGRDKDNPYEPNAVFGLSGVVNERHHKSSINQSENSARHLIGVEFRIPENVCAKNTDYAG